jgi:adenylate cyclase
MAEERVQRRLAAIMAADVVGYSRLMGEDETGTLTALKELRAQLIDPTIADYQGRIVKLMGDGALVEFASVVDAVECAVVIQSRMAERNTDIPDDEQLAFRIGINLGDVIIEGDDIYGDGVNVAARLEGIAEPGGVCVSDLVRQSVASKLKLTFEDMGEQLVKNIADPIRTYRIDVGRREILIDGPTSTETDAEFLQRPALAVLPFENLGGDPEQAYFADGLTEDIITALSLWRSFPVIARNSTFVYRGEAVKIQEVGRELGARYVLEGSVRKAGDRIRVTAQLIDADTGHHVWAEKFDRQFDDIFDLQDELTQKIASIVAPELERVEDSRAKVNQPQNLDAWHLVQRGMALLDEYTKETNLRAREMFGDALKLDPTYSRAYSGLALAYARAMMSGYEESREATTDKTMEAARKAVALDSSDAYAHNMLGMACLWARQFKDAISTFQRAVELNPSYGHARASLGDTLNRMGRTDEGISLMEDALRLNPDAPNLRHINAFLARACINARRYEDAVEWARKAIHLRSDLAHAHCLMAIALAHMGRSKDAKAALDECRRVQPDFFDSAVELSPYEDSAANEHLLDGLRKAGLKEEIDARDLSLPLPNKPSIAVLPFDNMSGDVEQEYFSDGITEDIITELSKISGLFVIARHSAFTYKGKSVTLMQVGRELGVRYVLEGSVRKAQNRLRITAQLIDATSDHHIWAERYDRDLEDIFAVQDEVARQVAGALAVALKPGEAERLAHAPTDNLEAYDVYLRTRMTFFPPTRANILTARGAYGHVIDTDPRFAGGHAGKSITHSMAVMFGHSENPEEDARIALEFAERAVTMDEQFALSHSALGFAYSAARRHNEAIAAALQAVELQPGNADSRFFLAYCQLQAGNGEEARDSILTALRLDPQYVAGPYLNALARACFVAGRYQEASDTFERNVAHGGPLGVPMLTTWLTSLVELERLDDARKIAQRLLEFDPGFSLMRAGNDAFGLASETSRERIVEALRKVGLPE